MNFGQNLYNWFLDNAQSLVLLAIVVIGLFNDQGGHEAEQTQHLDQCFNRRRTCGQCSWRERCVIKLI